MKKEWILFGAFLMFALTVAYIFISSSPESPTGHFLINDSDSLDVSNISSEDDLSSGDSPSSTSNEGSTSSETKDYEISQIPMCMLVRPGNLPDIGCFVSSITKEGVNLNLKNELGEDVGVEISLASCTPDVRSILENGQIKNFAFSCENVEDYFNQEISIAYILVDDKRVEIAGFISGPVN